jgi:FG-GAP-like repeat
MKDALVLEANYLSSSLLKNNGEGKFEVVMLPAMAQLSAINGMVVDDFDADGNADIVVNTNDFGTEMSVGRYDALNGLYLKGDGLCNFVPLQTSKSGIFVPGNGKGMVRSLSADGKYLVAAAQNRGDLKIFLLNGSQKAVPISASDVNAVVRYKNGKSQKQEFYYGSSFLSQSARFILANENITAITVTDSKGNTRALPLP